MPEMSDRELLSIVEQAENDAVIYSGTFISDNQENEDYYYARPFGDETEGKSQVVSTDVADVIDADMPSLVRVFLGSSEILTFEPNTDDPAEVQEAEEKTKYINWLVRNQPGSFKIIHDWMKGAEIQQTSVVKYFFDEEVKVEEHQYKNVSTEELQGIVASLQATKNAEIEVISRSDFNALGEIDVTFRTTVKDQCVKIVGVPPESFLISPNSTDKNTAPLVGDTIRATRGQLIADGFDEDLVKSLPAKSTNTRESSEMKAKRFRNEGGEESSEPVQHWTSEEVELSNLYVLVDFDGDGIPERRNILKSGNTILENEPFDHVPYAMLSATLTPHKAIGRCRADAVKQTQRVKSVLLRQTLDNQYLVNNGRNVVSDQVNLDDMLTVRANGVVRTSGPVSEAVFPLTTQSIAQSSLQMIQYMDQARAQSTGSLLASQGLDADSINKETATRFNGVEAAGAAKVELIARVFAETGFRDLYEGLAWTVSKFQDSETEIRVLGRQITINPESWKWDHQVTSSVGIGAGSGEELVNNLSAKYQIQKQLKAEGSPLVDDKKIYNTLADLMTALDMPRVSTSFNDPEQPDELVLAENEQLKQVVQQLQMQVEQLQNPLADAAKIEAQGKLIEAEGDRQLKAAKLAEDARQFDEKLKQDKIESTQDFVVDLTKLEADTGQDIEGSLI